MEEAYNDRTVHVIVPVNGRNGSIPFSLNISVGLYKSGIAVVKEALNSSNLFRDRGDHNLLADLMTCLESSDKQYGKHLLDTVDFRLAEYCTVFTHLMFELPEPLINEEITRQLCEVVHSNSSVASRFADVSSLDFRMDDPVLPGNGNSDTEVGLPFVITAAKKRFLQQQFKPADYQLVELMMYHLNIKLQHGVAHRDILVFVLNVFNQIIQRSMNPADDLAYLRTVFKNSVMDTFASDLQRDSNAVFAALVYGVGIVVPNIFHYSVRQQLQIPEIGQASELEHEIKAVPTPRSFVQESAVFAEISSVVSVDYATDNNNDTYLEEVQRDGNDNDNNITINTSLAKEVGNNDADSVEESEIETSKNDPELEEQAILHQLFAELELDSSSRIPFRMESPLLQHLNLPPPQTAVLVRSKYD